MALACPVSYFLIAFVAAMLMHIGIASGVFAPSLPIISVSGDSFVDGAAMLLSVLFILNVILGVFNLLPIPPLDGYSVLGLFVPERTYLQLLEFGRTSGFSFFGIILAYMIFPRVVDPVLSFAKYLFFLPLF